MANNYGIPASVTKYLRECGYAVPYGAMKSHIARWGNWLTGCGSFYDYRSNDSMGNSYRVHRRSAMPAKRVCKEWASLLMNEKTEVQCEDQACNDWLAGYYDSTAFWPLGQGLVMRAFGLGTGGWALWLNPAEGRMLVRRYSANGVLPLSWDDEGVTECAFVSRAYLDGKPVDQVQMHLKGENGTYMIRTAVFDREGRRLHPEGIEEELDTRCPTPTFAIVRPAVENTCVDFSPYGMSVFADAVDAIQAVDLAYDALFSEIDLGKIRIFVGDALIEKTDDDGNPVTIPFGRDDCTVYRSVSAADDVIKEFAPQLRTEAQAKAYRLAVQSLGDATGFGSGYFDIDKSGGIKTATEVSADNSQLMRNIRMHENLLGAAIAQVSKAVLHCAREFMGVSLPDEGNVTVSFDDSIITDTAAEKAQDMAEVGITMNAWEYRMKWYNEDEETAKANVPKGAAPAMFGDEL